MLKVREDGQLWFTRVEGEYYAVRRKPQYPKTYEECCDILQLEYTFELKDLTIDEEKTNR